MKGAGDVELRRRPRWSQGGETFSAHAQDVEARGMSLNPGLDSRPLRSISLYHLPSAPPVSKGVVLAERAE